MSRHSDTCEWLLLESSDNPLPLLIRVRGETPPNISIGDYPWLINIHWAASDGTENGMPGNQSMERMTQFEELLNNMDGDEVGFMMFSATGNNRKEWLWYAKNPDIFVQGLNTCLEGQEPFPIQIQSGNDSSWNAYCNIMNNVPKA